MDQEKERRYIDRIVLPETIVYFRRDGKINFIKPFQGPIRLIDISKSAARLADEMPFGTNTVLELKIIVPGYPAIYLKGRIREIDHLTHNSIIQILPFGIGRAYNSFHVKARFDLLLSRIVQTPIPLTASVG